jgi:hypothetical protein
MDGLMLGVDEAREPSEGGSESQKTRRGVWTREGLLCFEFLVRFFSYVMEIGWVMMTIIDDLNVCVMDA